LNNSSEVTASNVSLRSKDGGLICKGGFSGDVQFVGKSSALRAWHFSANVSSPCIVGIIVSLLLSAFMIFQIVLPLASESSFSLCSALALRTRLVQFRLPFLSASLSSSLFVFLALHSRVLRFAFAVLSSAVHHRFDFLYPLLSGVSRSISWSMYSRVKSTDCLVWLWFSQASGGRWNWEMSRSSTSQSVLCHSLLGTCWGLEI
jgi:hypothetical protein